MNATRDDLIEILRDVLQGEASGAEALGYRLTLGLQGLAEHYPGDPDIRALALDAIEALSEPD